MIFYRSKLLIYKATNCIRLLSIIIRLLSSSLAIKRKSTYRKLIVPNQNSSIRQIKLFEFHSLRRQPSNNVIERFHWSKHPRTLYLHGVVRRTQVESRLIDRDRLRTEQMSVSSDVWRTSGDLSMIPADSWTSSPSFPGGYIDKFVSRGERGRSVTSVESNQNLQHVYRVPLV